MVPAAKESPNSAKTQLSASFKSNIDDDKRRAQILADSRLEVSQTQTLCVDMLTDAARPPTLSHRNDGLKWHLINLKQYMWSDVFDYKNQTFLLVSSFSHHGGYVLFKSYSQNESEKSKPF